MIQYRTWRISVSQSRDSNQNYAFTDRTRFLDSLGESQGSLASTSFLLVPPERMKRDKMLVVSLPQSSVAITERLIPILIIQDSWMR